MYKVTYSTFAGEIVNTFDTAEQAVEWLRICVANKVKARIEYAK